MWCLIWIPPLKFAHKSALLRLAVTTSYVDFVSCWSCDCSSVYKDCWWLHSFIKIAGDYIACLRGKIYLVYLTVLTQTFCVFTWNLFGVSEQLKCMSIGLCHSFTFIPWEWSSHSPKSMGRWQKFIICCYILSLVLYVSERWKYWVLFLVLKIVNSNSRVFISLHYHFPKLVGEQARPSITGQLHFY